jgi:hypothetical protein
LAQVGPVIAQLTDPLEAKRRAPLTRQYVQMLASGKARITEPLGRATLTLAAIQVSRTDDDVPDIQARAQLVTAPIYSLHALPTHAAITDPAHRCRLDGCRVEIIARRAYCGTEHKREAARRRRAAHKIHKTD